MRNLRLLGFWLAVGLFGLASLNGPAQAADGTPENGVDRPGGDYRNFDLKDTTGSIAGPYIECQGACYNDTKCRAWTWVKPGIQGPKARCWLKNVIPPPHPNNCCASEVVVRAFEPGIDRPGKDYKNFDLTASDPNLCRSACSSDANCQAWTYVNPGVQGPKPRCWLKNAVPNAFVNGCCTSGASDRAPNVH